MILLDDTNIVTNFAEYLKYGLVGLSAIVLILTYFLLFKEQSRTGDARENILNAIKKYMWTALAFLIISGAWSLTDKYLQEGKKNGPIQPPKENCNKRVALYLELKDEQNLIDASDTLILQYRVNRIEAIPKEVPVYKEQGRFKALIDSVTFDGIYWVQLVNKTRGGAWVNKNDVYVSHTSADLFYSK
jgi:hypothetical protein